jgi:hypothetical protein
VGLVWLYGEGGLEEVLEDFYCIQYFGSYVVGMEDFLGEVCVL